MSKPYRPWSPGQGFLLPPSPLDWLPESHLVYFILDVVDGLDLDAIERVVRQRDPRGNRPYHPRMMTALLLYGYCTGVASSRKLERASYEDLPTRVLTGGQHPDHTVISEFRRVHLESFKAIFVTTVRLSQQAGLVKLGRVALDGTKVDANASKHKAMSYKRMLKTAAELEVEIERMLEQAEQADRQEDTLHGKGRRGDELPSELARREDRLRKIKDAMAALEAEAAKTRAETVRGQAETARAKAEQADDDEQDKKTRAADRAEEQAREAADKASAKAQARVVRAEEELRKAEAKATTRKRKRALGKARQALDSARRALAALAASKACAGEQDEAPALPVHRVPADKNGDPTPGAQRNFTDSDSRIMKRGGEYTQAFNAQAAADELHQIIVSCAVTNQPPDQEHLPAMLEQIEKNCGAYPDEFLGDAGYWDEAHVSFCEERDVDAYIATGRRKHGESPPAVKGRIPKNLDAKGRMRRKVATKKGKKAYSRRKAIIEPVFGQIKEARGFRRFLLRGIEKVDSEWALICAGHNLLKIFRARPLAA